MVAEMWMEPGSEDHRPEPVWQQRLGRPPSRRLGGPAPDATRVGLDDHGRPVLAELLWDGRVRHRDLMTWTDGQVEAVRPGSSSPAELVVVAFDLDGPVEAVSCEGSTRPDGEVRMEVERYDRDDHGRVGLAINVYESGSGPSWKPELGAYFGSTATRCRYDDHGELLLLEHLVGPSPIARGADHEAAFAQARRHAHAARRHGAGVGRRPAARRPGGGS